MRNRFLQSQGHSFSLLTTSEKKFLILVYYVTSTSRHQIFDEKFDQEPENVRIKMADLAGP